MLAAGVDQRVRDEVLLLADRQRLLVAGVERVAVHADRVGQAAVIVDIADAGVLWRSDNLQIKALLCVDRDRLVRLVVDEHRMPHRAGTATGVPDRGQLERRGGVGERQRELGAVRMVDDAVLEDPIQRVRHPVDVCSAEEGKRGGRRRPVPAGRAGQLPKVQPLVRSHADDQRRVGSGQGPTRRRRDSFVSRRFRRPGGQRTAE